VGHGTASMQQKNLMDCFFGGGAAARSKVKAAKRDSEAGEKENASANAGAGEPKFKRLKKGAGGDDGEVSVARGSPEKHEAKEASAAKADVPGPKSPRKEKKGLSLKSRDTTSAKESKPKKTFGVGEKSIAAAAASKSFDAKASATWKTGEPVPYGALAEAFDRISATSKRLEKTEIMMETFRAVISTTPEDLLPIAYLATCSIAPPHEGIELGIGDATLIKCLSESTGRTEKAVKQDMKQEADLGKVAMMSRSSQRTMFQPKPLTVRQVFQDFKTIALTEGKDSMDRKKKIIKKLLTSSKKSEATYVVRALQGSLRIGASEQTILAALARAALWEKGEVDAASDESIASSEDAALKVMKKVFSECPSLDKIVPAMMEHGVADLPNHCKFTVGVPVSPMLAKPTTGVHEVLEKFTDTEFTCEYKYDGERAQLHYEGGKLKIFSRNAEDNTEKYPEIRTEILPKSLRETTENVVLDGEVVAYDRETKQILPFQNLQRRKRKDVSEEDLKKQATVCYFAFDCLYYNGTSLLQSTLVERRKALREACQEREGLFFFATDKTSDDLDELQVFLDDAIEAKTEGLIVKTVDSTYEPSQRSVNWLKLKKDYMEGIGDSLDLVVVGAWHGKGKRKGWYGNYLLACYNEDNEEYEIVSKIGTGLTEEELDVVKKQLDPHKIDGPCSYYKFKEGSRNEPDVWFDAQVVWEVKVANLTLSPHYLAAFGSVESGKGISLRFPRYERTRDDRTPTSATTSDQLQEMYENQLEAGASRGNGGDFSD